MRYHGSHRYLRGALLGLLSLCSSAAIAVDWQQIEHEAKGQTVWFNAWGGDEAVNQTLIPIIHTQWGLATAFSFLAFYVYAPMCLATLAVIRRETNSLKQTIAIASYLFVLAYLMAWLTYRVTGQIFGF